MTRRGAGDAAVAGAGDDVDAAAFRQVRLAEEPVEAHPGPVLRGVPAPRAVEDSTDAVAAVEVTDPDSSFSAADDDGDRITDRLGHGVSEPSGDGHGRRIVGAVLVRNRAPAVRAAGEPQESLARGPQRDRAYRQSAALDQGPAGEVAAAGSLAASPGMERQEWDNADGDADVDQDHRDRGDAYGVQDAGQHGEDKGTGGQCMGALGASPGRADDHSFPRETRARR